MPIQIPLNNQPNQSFNVSIPLAIKNIVLSFFAKFNTISGYWEIDISNGATGEQLIFGLPLLSGLYPAANLIEAFGHLDIGAAYVTPLHDDAPAIPGENSWGVDYVFVWDDAPTQ